MFWGKKPDDSNPTADKPVVQEEASKWIADGAGQGCETFAWDNLRIPVLSASEIEAMLAGRFGKIRSALGTGTLIQGKLSFDTPVRIDGKLSGEIFSSEALIVGASGIVDAQLEVASLVVLGTVKGRVKASQSVEVYNGGKLEAEITAPQVKVEEGAHFSGKCSMPAVAREQRASDARSKAGDKSEGKGGISPGKNSGLDEIQLH